MYVLLKHICIYLENKIIILEMIKLLLVPVKEYGKRG